MLRAGSFHFLGRQWEDTFWGNIQGGCLHIVLLLAWESPSPLLVSSALLPKAFLPVHPPSLPSIQLEKERRWLGLCLGPGAS